MSYHDMIPEHIIQQRDRDMCVWKLVSILHRLQIIKAKEERWFSGNLSAVRKSDG